MLNILRAVFGGVMLFLGRDMAWLFSIGTGLLVGQMMLPLLPPDAPLWMQLVLVGAMGVIGILPYIVYPESSFIVTGFLFGGYMLAEYANIVLQAFFNTTLSGPTGLIFFVGAVIGAAVLGLIKEWGVMLATSLVGAFLVADLFPNLAALTRILIASGLFIIGGIIQTIIMRMEKASER